MAQYTGRRGSSDFQMSSKITQLDLLPSARSCSIRLKSDRGLAWQSRSLRIRIACVVSRTRHPDYASLCIATLIASKVTTGDPTLVLQVSGPF